MFFEKFFWLIIFQNFHVRFYFKNIDQVDDRVFLNGTVLAVDLTELAPSLKISLRTKPRLEVATISKVEGWLIPGDLNF